MADAQAPQVAAHLLALLWCEKPVAATCSKLMTSTAAECSKRSEVIRSCHVSHDMLSLLRISLECDSQHGSKVFVAHPG